MALVAGAAAAVLTLDIADAQILIHRPADPNGLTWHHWILLKRLAPGQWLGLTPLGASERVDLANVQHVVLERLAQFPAAQRATVLAHDPVSRAALESHKRRAVTTAALLGDADLADIQSSAWRIAEPQRTDFAAEVDVGIVNDPVTGLSFDRKGVILMQGEEVYVEKVMTCDLETWKLGLVPSSVAKRLLTLDRWTNPPNLAAGEQLTRWLIQTESGAERNPRHQDFTGSDIASGSVIHKSGRANAGKYQGWLSGRLKELGTMWKQDRLYRQEQQRLHEKGGGGGGEDISDEHDGEHQKKKPKGSSKGGHKREARANDGRKGASVEG
jgi:hypothetical protein